MSQSDTPSLGLDPDEPHTPTWFTALGVILFLFGVIFILATGDDGENTAIDSRQGDEAEGAVDEAEPGAETGEAE